MNWAYSIDRELRAGEKIVWQGSPAKGIKLRAADALIIPFSLMWGGFVIFWETAAVTLALKKGGATALLFPVFGIPFVVVGVYIMVGRFIVDAIRRMKTEYAITNQRVIIKSGVFSKKVRSLSFGSIPEVSFTEKSNNSGTITFGSPPSLRTTLHVFYWPGMPFYGQSPAFEMIEDVRDVYEMIQKEQIVKRTGNVLS